MTGALSEPKVSSEKTITKNIAYADKLIQIGSGAGLFTMIFASIFMIYWGEPKDALTVAIVGDNRNDLYPYRHNRFSLESQPLLFIFNRLSQFGEDV